MMIPWIFTSPITGGYTIVTGSGGGGGGGAIAKNKDGCDCKKCKEFYPYAEPNQEDGTLICYKCRIGW